MSGFHARGGCAIAYLSDDARCGVPREKWNQNHATSGGLDLLPTDNLIGWPIAAFDKNIRKQFRNDLARCRFVKDHYSIDTF